MTLLALAVIVPAGRSAAGDEPSPDVTEPPPYEQFVVIPLRVHVLRAADLPEVDCALSDADVARIIGKVNAIWHVAGIHWGLDSVVREPADGQDKFRLARDLNGSATLESFRVLLPEASRHCDGLHVYYIHKFRFNGVYLGDDFALVQETAKLDAVEGGIDEPIPRVTAHELGHALGLPHRQNKTNLLASGTTGTLLNAQEVERAREGAHNIKGSIPAAEVRKLAEQAVTARDTEKARRLWRWLAEIPGAGAAEAQRRLGELQKP